MPDEQLVFRTMSMPRAQFPPQITEREWADVYTNDITTCAGIRNRTYEHLAQVTFQAGNRALADVIASNAYRIGMREMDRLELEKDVEGMKEFGRQWLKELTGIARGEEG